MPRHNLADSGHFVLLASGVTNGAPAVGRHNLSQSQLLFEPFGFRIILQLLAPQRKSSIFASGRGSSNVPPILFVHVFTHIVIVKKYDEAASAVRYNPL